MNSNVKIKLDYNNMMADFIGKEQGFTEQDFIDVKGLTDSAFRYVQKNKGKGMMGWTELSTNQDEVVEDIIATAKDIRASFKNFVVLGIGGSALGPIAVFQALKHLRYNELSDSKRGGPKFYVEDNIDPERMNALLDVIDVKQTVFNVITKSGATSETMSQYLVIIDILKKELGKDYVKHIVATTSENKGNLIKLAKKEGYKTFFIPDSVGGRFSELCPVGLLAAAVLDIDIKALLKGAQYMMEQCEDINVYNNPALMSATLQYLSMGRGKNVSVMMPYADSLKFVADWYCQLWGESLGKDRDLNGKMVYAGQTPVKALGVTDQHSQVQLYTEGPFDKVITIIAVDEFRSEVVIPEGLEEFPDVNFLCGTTMGNLLNTERKATEYALTKAARANHTITVPVLDEFSLGQLLMLFMLETAYCGAMLNIDTFNQPGVEEGKNATYALFGRAGYEEKKKELESARKKSNKYII
jgi:glucose-6-phosphate isomerase